MSPMAPVALFVYRRLDHVKATVQALRQNIGAELTDLHIFSDGPKDRASEDTINGFRSVKVIERPKNRGLAASIISGVSDVLNSHSTVIVVEDDLITSPYFLTYMNDGLRHYVDDSRVVSIHGYVYPVTEPLPETFFLRGADCWGWATWRRGWKVFNPDGQALLDSLESQKLMKEFDFDGAFKFSEMLRNQIQGLNDSWAIRWYASAFLSGGLTLYPGHSLVNNVGIDGSGTHCAKTGEYDVLVSSKPIVVGGIAVEDSQVARQAFMHFGHRSATQSASRSWSPKALLKKLVGRH
jgi:hypothetical protein